jgi:hypothetical protein
MVGYTWVSVLNFVGLEGAFWGEDDAISRHLAARAYVALNPPSRFNTQLFAYWFRARNQTASATSSDVPSLLAGIFCESAVGERSMYISFVIEINSTFPLNECGFGEWGVWIPYPKSCLSRCSLVQQRLRVCPVR